MNTVTSPPRKRRFAALAGLKSLALGCGLLLFAGLEAASPPTVYQAYTTGGAPIQAGMVADSATGKLYFATLGKTGENPKVVCLNANHTVAWTYDLGANGKVRCVPRLSADGTKLYVGTDDARLICLTSAGSLVFSYPVPGSGDRKVRNTPALGSGQVYFHCNDGKLYALNATSGALVSGWPVTTGNTGGPPVYGDHTDTWSSSPVVAPGGQVYVGSANGRVYGFTSAGSKILDVSIGYPMESNLALGSNGWLYGGTREHVSYAQNGQGGVVFAVNPAAYTVGNPQAALVWQEVPASPWGGFGTGPLAYLANPVLDGTGAVYFAHFGHVVWKYDALATSATLLDAWFANGKLCQTPAINQNRQLLLGASASPSRFCSLNLNASTGQAEWEITAVGGVDFSEFLGSVTLRNYAGERAYFADMSGRVFYLATPPVTVGLDATDLTATEIPGDPGLLTLHRSVAGAALTVSVDFAGSATFGPDYGLEVDDVPATTAPTSLTFAAGQADIVLRFSPVDDTRVENNEAITVTVLSGAGYAVETPAARSVVISDPEDVETIPGSYLLTEFNNTYASQMFAVNNAGYVAGAIWIDSENSPNLCHFVGNSLNDQGRKSWGFGLNNATPPRMVGQRGHAVSGGTVGGWMDLTGSYLEHFNILPRLVANSSGNEAVAVTDDGIIAGHGRISSANSTIHAFRWDDTAGAPVDLGTLASDGTLKSSYASAITSGYRVAGRSQGDWGASYHGFLTQPAAAIVPFTDDLGTGTALDSDSSEANGINDLGEIVGATHFTVSGQKRYLACLKSSVVGRNLGFVNLTPTKGESVANAINAGGIIVGSYKEVGSSTQKGMAVFPGGTLVDLKTKAGSPAGWEFSSAEAINTQGWIVGWGYKNGQLRGFLLKPQ